MMFKKYIGIASLCLCLVACEGKVNMQNKIIVTPQNIHLNTESFGDQKDPAVLLISGAMSPARFYTDEFCTQIVDAGYFVIRYDHRDMGLSDSVDYLKNPYCLNDIAKDAVAILDDYKIKKAHIIGHSMGGAIAQLLALDYSDRVLCIVPISSAVLSNVEFTDEEKAEFAKTWEVISKNKPTKIYEESVDGFLQSYKYFNGDVEMDEDLARQFIKDMYKRSKPEHVEWFDKYSKGIDPVHNHVKAQHNIVDRTEDLRMLQIPTLVIYGQNDLLLFPRVIQKYCIDLIPNAKVFMISGMGHMIFNRELEKKIANACVKFFKENKNEKLELKMNLNIIETERLILRNFVMDDDKELLNIMADGGMSHLAQFGPLDINYARGFLNRMLESYKENNFGLWAIIEKETGKLIGYCGLHKVKINVEEEKVELAYRIYKKLWGKGLAVEAAKAVCEYAFGSLNLREIVSCIAHENERSARVAQKVGLIYWKEGVFKGMPCRVYRLLKNY